MLPFSRWRAGHLLVAWCGYWVALLIALLAPMIPWLWRVTRPDAHGSFSASAGDGALRVVFTQGAATVWTGEIRLLTLTVLIAVPPLLLWTAWLRAHRRPSADKERVA